MRRFLGGLFKATGALVLAAGVVGVLVCAGRAVAQQKRNKLKKRAVEHLLLTPPATATVRPADAVQRKFSIKRTKSEVGYVYWILEGYGEHKCFVLCDTWQEAVQQAKLRLQGAGETAVDLVSASS